MSVKALCTDLSCFLGDNGADLNKYDFSCFNDNKNKPITIDFSQHKNFAFLAEEAYNFDKSCARECVNGYRRVKEFDTCNYSTGFQGCVFENDNLVVISFRGSDGDDGDLSSNTQMFFNSCPSQYYDARNLYERVCSDSRFKNKKIILTGHSLGGSLAQLVASTPDESNKNESSAITFNPFGRASFISEQDSGFEDFGNCVNYVIKNDIVGTSCEHPGTVVGYYVSDENDLSFTTYHGVNQFINNEDDFEKAYNDIETQQNNDEIEDYDDGKSILSICLSAVGDFLCACKDAVVSFFGIGHDESSIYIA